MSTVFVFTDCTDVAKLEIKLSIFKGLKDSCNLDNIEIINVKEYSLKHCSFLMRLIAELAPNNSIFYPVVNPCMKEYERISGRTKKKGIYFIGRNTGVFNWLLNDFGVEEINEYKDIKFKAFGGKNIYPKMIKSLIDKKYSIKMSTFNPCNLTNLTIKKGSVLHIDNFGLVKINYYISGKFEIGEKVSVKNTKTGEEYQGYYHPRIMSNKDNDIVIYSGSSLNGLMEIGCVRNTTFGKNNFSIGDIIEVNKL